MSDEESEEIDPDAEGSSEQLSGEVEESEEKAVTAEMIIEWTMIFEPLSDSRRSARTDTNSHDS